MEDASSQVASYFIVEASPEAIQDITRLEIPGFRFSEPRALDGSGVLDAPISGAEIQAALQMITVVFTTTAAVLKFADEVVKILKERKQAPAVLRDVNTGETRTTIDATSAPTDVQKALQP